MGADPLRLRPLRSPGSSAAHQRAPRLARGHAPRRVDEGRVVAAHVPDLDDLRRADGRARGAQGVVLGERRRARLLEQEVLAGPSTSTASGP